MEKFRCRDCGKKFYTPGDVPRKCPWCAGDVDPVGEPETATATLMSTKEARLSDVLGFVPSLEIWQEAIHLLDQARTLVRFAPPYKSDQWQKRYTTFSERIRG